MTRDDADMKIELIERLVDIAQRAGVGVLEYSDADGRVRLQLKNEVEDAPSAPSRAVEVTVPAPEGRMINASMVGVFYRASAPDQPAFVKVGDIVNEGQTLGIVEAMKMLNPIEAPSAGRITKVLVSDGQSVEHGMPLFTIEEILV